MVIHVWHGLQVFAKCGVLKEDDDRKPKVKVYRDRETQVPKGDGLVTYLKEPSVSQPIDLECLLMSFSRGLVGNHEAHTQQAKVSMGPVELARLAM